MSLPKHKRSGLAHRSNNGACGMTIIELMIAVAILAIGMAGLTVLFSSAATSSNRNKLDTNSTLVAKMVMEQIAAQNPANPVDITLQDCAQNTFTVTTVGDTFANGGAGAPLDNNPSSLTYGGIDFSQPAVANYSMQYKDCQTGQTTTYDIRWNIINVSPGFTRLITVAARQNNVSNKLLGGPRFAMPVSLRTVSGPSAQ